MEEHRFSVKVKRVTVIRAGLLLMLMPLVFLLFMRFLVVPRERYPTWEAVRNILVKDGEIVIVLPDEVKVLSARYDHPQSEVFINDQIVTTKIGYSISTVVLEVEIRGRRQILHINPQKPNNWNRIRFEPIDPGDPLTNYRKIENGIKKSHYDFSRETAAD